MLATLSRGVIRARFLVVALWIAVIGLGGLASVALPSHLTTSLVVPNSDSTRADQIQSKYFGENSEGAFTVVYDFGQASNDQILEMKAALERAALAIPTAKVAQVKAVGGILYAGIGTSLNLVQASAQTENLRLSLHKQGLHKALVTGPPAIQGDFTPILSSDLRHGALLAIVIAIAILILIFGFSWIVVVPFITAAATISAAVGVVYLLALKFLMVLYVPNVIELIGLGLAIDYSILIAHRFHHELEKNGRRVNEAITVTMSTAGRTVLLSGITASIGLTTLFLVPVPFIRSLGAAGLVVPLVSVIAALTLQPAVLAIIGGRIKPARGSFGLFNNRDEVREGMWARIADRVTRRPWFVLASAVTALLIAASSILWLELTPTSLKAIPQGIESAKGVSFIADRIGPGLITPNAIVIDYGKSGQALRRENLNLRNKLALDIIGDNEVLLAITDNNEKYIDPSGRFQRILVMGRHEFGAQESKAFVQKLRNYYIAKSEIAKKARVYVGGASAQGVDFLKSVYSIFPWIIISALAIAYFLLVRSFRSLLLPAIAVGLDLLSLAATYGLLVAVFRFGFLSPILGTYHVSQIEGWVPVFLFAVLFGLSMDYEVFIVARMREAWDNNPGGEVQEATKKAISEGLSHTGGVVTAAAIILVGALGGLANGHIAGLQELGVGLALGVLIDATIVRTLVLPALMTLLGRWIWRLPEPIARAAFLK